MFKRKIKRRRVSKSDIFINTIVTLVLCLFVFLFLVVPKVKLNESFNKTININSSYQNEGITINTFPFNKKVVKPITNINTKDLGIKQLDYDYKSNIFTFHIKQNVIVKDIEKPKIILKGNTEEYYCPNGKYKELGYKAYDNVDKDITDKVKVERLKDKIIYRVIDSSGNKKEVTRYIKQKDIDSPNIILNGESNVFLSLNESYIEEGVVVSDNCDKDLTAKVEITNNINNTKVGDYKVIYKVKDNSNNKSKTIRNVKVRESLLPNTIYLTFDDGPRDGTTDKILDILKEKNVKATFFITGNGTDSLVKRIVNEGHSIGIHTASHRYDIIYTSIDNYYNDLEQVHDRIYNLTGVDTKLLRFPGGSSNTISKKYSEGIMSILTKDVVDKGYQYYDWNIDSTDAEYNTSKDDIYNNIINTISHDKYNVILMHDTKNKTVEALPLIIDYAKSNGYNFSSLNINTMPIRQKVNN